MKEYYDPKYPPKPKDCPHPEVYVSDFSFYEQWYNGKNRQGRTRHEMCHLCGKHWLRDEEFTREEWEKYVNEE